VLSMAECQFKDEGSKEGNKWMRCETSEDVFRFMYDGIPGMTGLGGEGVFGITVANVFEYIDTNDI